MRTAALQVLTAAVLVSGGAAAQPVGDPSVAEVVIEAAPGTPRPPFSFCEEDAAFLDEVQRGAFLYFWHEVHEETGMVRDRSGAEVVSVAGVGFQLSALPIGVERGWVDREDAAARARLILESLLGAPSNRRAGLFFHYLDGRTGEPSLEGYEVVASTIDTALLFAGVITASAYFGGDIAEMGDEILAGADWTAFTEPEPGAEFARGFISLGWQPDERTEPGGPGSVLPFSWIDAGDEHRLVTFLAVCAGEGRGLAPEMYYRLRRKLGDVEGVGKVVWFPWSGALFTAFFSHCWMDYAHMGVDDPAKMGVARRSRVDWWENSRRLAEMHRRKAVENPLGFKTVGPRSWGLGASDGPTGYHVAHLHPSPAPMPGAIEGEDYPPENPGDEWLDGTIAPYAAGSSIMFLPEESVAALRHARGLRDAAGAPLVWREPDPSARAYGFLDAYNLDAGWVASDYVAIDQGPLLLAIENARTGLVWRLFHSHELVQRGMERLGLDREGPDGAGWERE